MEVNSSQISPKSLQEFRKQIYGSHGSKQTALGMRQSGKQSSLATANLHGRGSLANASENSETKIGAFSKPKLKEESSIAKSSKEKDGDTNSAISSHDDSDESEVFVRTKAVAHHDHNHSSMDEVDGNYDTMKHNDQNIIANSE